jgi:hypothetical protein
MRWTRYYGTANTLNGCNRRFHTADASAHKKTGRRTSSALFHDHHCDCRGDDAGCRLPDNRHGLHAEPPHVHNPVRVHGFDDVHRWMIGGALVGVSGIDFQYMPVHMVTVDMV